MAAMIDSHFKTYQRSYLVNRYIDFNKICCKSSSFQRREKEKKLNPLRKCFLTHKTSTVNRIMYIVLF